MTALNSILTGGIVERISHGMSRKAERGQQAQIKESNTRLPSSCSDLTASLSIAPNDDGLLVMGIYLMGGCYRYSSNTKQIYDCENVAKRTWVYEPFEDVFITRRDMPIPRYRHISASINGDSIWVLTGRDHDNNLIAQIDVYTPETDQWITLPAHLPPSLQISDGAFFTQESFLYIVGGYDNEHKATGNAVVIDTEATLQLGELVFRDLKPMNTPRGDLSAIVFGRYAYVVGGFTHANAFCAPLPTTEIFDFLTNEWSYAADLNIARGGVSLVIFNGRMFAFGGETTDSHEEDVSCEAIDLSSTSYEINQVTKMKPVNSVEVLTVNMKQYDQQVWNLAYSKFLPPDNPVFRSVAVAFPTKSVVYAFGGIYYQNENNEEVSFAMKTSDKVIQYVDDFKYGNQHGQSFGESSSSYTSYLIGGSVIFIVYILKSFFNWKVRRRFSALEYQSNAEFCIDGVSEIEVT